MTDSTNDSGTPQQPTNLVTDQPPPTPNDRPAIWDLVIEDMKARDRVGRERYRTPLQPFNGRDALTDLYQELLDATVYCRQEIEERESAFIGLRELLDKTRKSRDEIYVQRNNLRRELADTRTALERLTKELAQEKEETHRQKSVIEELLQSNRNLSRKIWDLEDGKKEGSC